MLRRSCGTFQWLSWEMSRPATTMRPVLRLLLPEQQAQEGRLPRAGRTDQEDELALLDLGGDLAQRDDVALVDLGDVLEANHDEGREGSSGRRGIWCLAAAMRVTRRLTSPPADAATAGTPR